MKFLLFWVASFLFAVLFLFWVFPPVDERTFEDAALGEQTQTVIGMLGGHRVHCFTMKDGEECIKPALERQLDKTMVWLGNSQLHAINQLKDSDVLSSVKIAEALRDEGIEMLTFSQPNATLQEHLIMYEALSERINIDYLLLPLVFDDTREIQIRPDIKYSLKNQNVYDRLKQSEAGSLLLQETSDVENPSASGKTFQARSENYITSVLENLIGWEKLRERARGSIRLSIYKIRNSVFGINSSSIRKKIPGAYAANIAAFEQILISAKQNDVSVLVYIPPLRSDVPRPYDPDEYETFKFEVQEISRLHGSDFFDFETLVPGKFWGTMNSINADNGPTYDFMHFRGEGHDLLADAIIKTIQKKLLSN